MPHHLSFRLSAVAAAVLAALVSLTVGDARAAYIAKVRAGTLTITGDTASDKLVLRLQAGAPSTLEVDVGDDGSADFSFDRSTFTAIDVVAGAGDDEVRIDESGGSFTDEIITIKGGGGADTLAGGSGAETLSGGDGADKVTGGSGVDRALLGGGNDRFSWSPGDGSDAVEGQGGADALDFDGNAGPDGMDVAASGQRVRLTRGTEALDVDDVERVAVRPLAGADAVVAGDLAGTDVTAVDVDLNALGGGGGDGEVDTFTAQGTVGPDNLRLSGGNGEVVVGGLGAQTRLAAGEAFDDVNVATLGEADTITTGVGVAGPAEIDVDGGDGADTTNYEGTAAADQIQVVANGTEVRTDAAATAPLDTTAVERLVVRGLAGTDTIAGIGNLAPLTQLTLDGGTGADTLLGGNGGDILLGGDGSDFVDGNQGQDAAVLGAGADRFQWDPGDSSDTVEGQTGIDALEFNGSNIGEAIEIAADGPRARLTRNVGSVVMDFDDVELVALRVFGGADAITTHDLTGTDLGTVDLDLQATAGGGDAQADTLVTEGTEGPDAVTVTRVDNTVAVGGLAAQIGIAGSEAASDVLTVRTLGGDDDVTVAPDVSDLIAAVVDLGPDE